MKRKNIVIKHPQCYSKKDSRNPKCKTCIFCFDCIERSKKNGKMER